MSAEEAVLARKMGISIMAGQGLGKERAVGIIGLHYHFCLKVFQPKGVCTAPAGPTLHSTLWPEFGKVIASSEFFRELFDKQSNRIFLKEDPKRGEFMRIEPRTIQQNSSPDEQAVVLAGIHATGVLYIVTEASGVQDAVFKPLEGGLTDPLSMIIMIFNPTHRTGFAVESHGKNRQDWVCLQWSGRTLKREKQEKPGRFKWFNDEAQDVLIRKFGEDSDFVRVRVDGFPPRHASNTLIAYDDVMAAKDRQVLELPSDPLVIPIDVGGAEEGGDETDVFVFRGPRLKHITVYEQKEISQLGHLVAGHLKTELTNLDPGVQFAIGVDSIGLGRGLYDNLINIQKLANVHAIDVSEKPLDEKRFHRLRDQVWWEVREAFMEKRTPAFSPDLNLEYLDELIGELTSIKWAEVNGKIKVQGKGSSSGIPGVPPLTSSPNKADAFCIGWWVYQHCCSRMPAQARRRRYVRDPSRLPSWKTM